jgi:hypothetical protein
MSPAGTVNSSKEGVMGNLVVGIDPGKSGAMVLAEDRKLLMKAATPVTKGSGRKQYVHSAISSWFKQVRELAEERGIEVVAGLESSWPIPARDVLPETEYYAFAEQIKTIFTQAQDISVAGRERFETDAVISAVKAFLMKFYGKKESNSTAFAQGEGVMLWRVHLWYHGIRYIPFAPAKWHAEICQGKSGANPKARALAAAEELYPGEDFKLPRGRVANQGVVDAACVAEMARRSFYTRRPDHG